VPDQRNSETLETDQGQPRSVSPYKAGFRCLCPHCGASPLYNGLLDVKDRCDGCGFDLSAIEPGDGAQVFVILALGIISTLVGIILYNLGLSKEMMLLILGVVVIGGAIWLLRIFKALFVALQFHHTAGQVVLKDHTTASEAATDQQQKVDNDH
jgi:uncharacterized protein (DUF983 family)